MIASEASVRRKTKPSKTDKPSISPELRRSLLRVLIDAFDKSLELTPHTYVDVMTMSSAELGGALKCVLRDEVFEARRRKGS